MSNLSNEQKFIEIIEAKVHNLKNVSVKIPKDQLVVLTGVSGSGKSSLAFDTLYAEGQRRYVESLSSYARQFLGLMEKPNVKAITGLSPAISIDQKTSSSNPRSTVGTITEVYDYLRLLFAQIGKTHCPNCGRPVQAQTIAEISKQITGLAVKGESAKIQILSPLIQDKKGTFQDIFDNLLSKGFLRVRIDGETHSLEEIENLKIDKNKKHKVDLIIDRLVAPEKADVEAENDKYQEFAKRLNDAIELSTQMADGEVKVIIDDKEHFFSENNTCFHCKVSFPQIKAASFSFNSPIGACETCSGLGALREVDVEKIYNPKLSIAEGGIYPWSNRTTSDSWTAKTLEEVARAHNFSLKTAIGKLSKEHFDLIFYGIGTKSAYQITYTNRQGQTRMYEAKYEGVIEEMMRRYNETTSNYMRAETEKYMTEKVCSTCEGKRLKRYTLAVTIGDKNIASITDFQVEEAVNFFDSLKLKGNQKEIAEPILKEITSRLKFLSNVGLNYLTLGRRANSLSGGESQRIRLASQIGTGLTGVLYVLDEPSIGLHSRDVSRLIGTLEELRDIGNSVVVVEHDYDTIQHADYVIDVGPFAGELGGEIVAQGNLKEFLSQKSLTADYLKGTIKIGQDLEKDPEQYAPKAVEKPKSIIVKGAKTNNLKGVDVEFPLGKFVAITGVSGSGKSSLVNDTLYPVLMNEKMHGERTPGEYDEIVGLENVHKVIGIDQSPIGRTPRSNPITYTGAFDYIRELYAQTPESRARGYKSGRFSFNVKGGRCEKCGGEGQIKIEMQFLADMYVTCEDCQGKRYNKEALQIDYKGKSIADVLDMTVDEAKEFFANITTISRKLDLLQEVGLGYIRLGQYATTLSGGESQRIKLARELSKTVRGHTVYILDEPTTGLHFHDVDKLLKVLKRLVAIGNTVIVIEHNMDMIRYADWVIDMGPEGGDGGGNVVAAGTVEDVVKVKESHTGRFLKEYLESIHSTK